jgi:predicted transglutaminase-like cysteine proteinase
MTSRLTGALLALCAAAASPVSAQGVQAASAGIVVPPPSPLRHAVATSPDVFGTAAVAAGVTFYDARFRRVAKTDRAHPLVAEIAATLRGLSPEQQLMQAHRQVLQKVRWAHDLDTMRVADLWANAGETLERGAGDSEDIAIVAMQVLKAAGWNPADLYISIGREKKVGTHVVLLARAPSGFYVLDDRANRAMTPREHARFTPILTIGEGKSWIHGRRRAASSPRISAR